MEVLGLVDIPLCYLLAVLCLLTLYIYGSYPMQTWKRLGVPCPDPLPFIGNTHQLFASKKGVWHSVDKLIRRHGRIFGMHYFRVETLLVADLDALKEVFVKDFNNYSDRFHIGEGTFFQPCIRKSLFFQNGMSWKRIRRIVSPSFTIGKLKLLTHYVNKTARQLQQKLLEHAEEGSHPQAKIVFGAFSLDVIGGTAFGLDLDSQNNLKSPFLQHANGIFQLKALLKFAMGIACIFPFMGSLLHTLNISILDEACVQFFKKQITRCVMERKTNPDQFEQADFLQLLLNAEIDSDEEDVAGEKKLTTEELISQGILFIIAGYETTSTAMQFLTYLLAKHQDVQERLVKEMDAVLGDADELTYEDCQRLKYTESVIHETLRMYPPICSMNRQAVRDTELKGYRVPAGTVIRIDIVNVMRDPDVYEDPDTFNPDRFMTGCEKLNNFVGFLPFGFGPRQCIGMRLAMLEIKIALVHMLRKVAIVGASPDGLDLIDYTGMLSAREPIQLHLVKR